MLFYQQRVADECNQLCQDSIIMKKNNTAGASAELKRLDIFVGEWETTGEIKATANSPATILRGTDTYKWLPGEYFMIHLVDVKMGEEQVYSTEIIGYDPLTKKYSMHYYGYKGKTGMMHASVADNTWRFTGETERFTGSFNDPGDLMSGYWERLENSEWKFWMDIQLKKVG